MPMVNVLSLVQYLFNEHGVQIPLGSIQYFWDHARTFFPWGEHHPATAFRAHVPVALHGDEARYTNGTGCVEKVVVLTLSMPLWRPATSRNSRYVLCALRESLCLGHRTLFPLFHYITWALNILFFGKKVPCDYQGRALPRSLQAASDGEDEWICSSQQRFALTELRGDWSWHREAMRLSSRWNSADVCFKCTQTVSRKAGATLNDGYMDYSNTASWISNQVSHIQFLNTMLARGPI